MKKAMSRKPRKKSKASKATPAAPAADIVQEGDPRPLVILFAAAPFIAGLYYEWSSCLAGLYLLIYLLYCQHKNGRLCIPRSWQMYAMAVLAAGYGLTAVWGTDHGMALLGFAKFLPLPLFVLALAQTKAGTGRKLLQSLPATGAVMTAVSMLLSRIPRLQPYFLINQRLAGFFQYANTFALYLLLGVAVLLFSGAWRPGKTILLFMLLLGIFLSGSRTVFILLAVLAAAALLLIPDRSVRLTLLGLIALFLCGSAVYAAVTGNFGAAARYLTTSLSSSTFLGRLLYFQDALPVILRHPFGLGYMGYASLCGSFQTGVYSLQNVHNELLQLLLDVGWFPAVLALYALFRSVQRAAPLQRAILLLTAAHCMLDFDLQFVAIDFILLNAMEPDGKTARTVKPPRALAAVCGGVLVGVCLYFGLASGLYTMRNYTGCVAVAPFYTKAWTELLTQAADLDETEAIAERILELNPSVSLAYSAKARAAFGRGDIADMISYKQQAIGFSRYSLAEYLDYFDMLYIGIELYRQNGDIASAEYCRERLQEIPAMLAQTLAGTSPLGWQINDKPQLELPAEYEQKLQMLSQPFA